MSTPYTIGRQGSIVLIWNGERIDLQDVVNFSVQQESRRQRTNPLNKPPVEFSTPAGWRGSFTVDRGNSALDKLFDADELAYWNANSISSGVLYCYIQESDGTTSKYEYSGIALTFTNAGSFQAENIVTQTVTFFASQRREI
ncbi:hypothetical protein AA23498_0103 [Acetobacter nitrogenifigens DSM 23921 = NBRC 105050]|uniref:Phage tail protein n=1 Tax=Acetobacter nitrogenifigens DSM 23921 = NBRC 105050 TaxID=1120919 RepID=A0A511X8W9_9PROT|nr:hypothetical protein [Acetobacter nitrogenifigens]GBQ87316.1 hypothetical protein AA23498_0103 [Acetobacter nitrogenifigens DSM 23921 = NBRC 105050]GEN59382.1 hypothetical protein ANI02nite_12660 [Acetobacter nitrogenifigens DSM 23921 = NBRC 105050]